MVVRGHQYSPLIGWQGCEQSQRSIPHRKLMPECTNVTKHNCVLSNWETDEYGNQVWAGNEECDPISWQECKLVPKDVKLGKNNFINNVFVSDKYSVSCSGDKLS